MTFIVFDQGYRTETPWYDLFPQKKVNAPQASNALHAATMELEKEPASEQHPRKNTSAAPYKQASAVRRRIGCAADIMSQPVISIAQEQNIQAVSQAFKQHAVHHMPVLNAHDKLVGLVSDRDLLRFQANHNQAGNRQANHTPEVYSQIRERLSGHDVTQHSVKDIMTQRVLTAQPHTGIPQLAEVMVQHRIGALPIVDPEGQLQGMITRVDILRAIMIEAPIELWV